MGEAVIFRQRDFHGQHFARDAAWPQDHDRFSRCVHDRGFESDVALSSVQYQIHMPSKIFGDHTCRRRAGASAPIRGRRRDRKFGFLDQRQGDPVLRHAKRNRLESPPRVLRNEVTGAQDERQRARPESPHEGLRTIVDHSAASRMFHTRYV